MLMDDYMNDESEKLINDLDYYIKKAIRIIKVERNISSLELADELGLDPMLFIVYIQESLVHTYNRKYFTVKEIMFCSSCKKYYDNTIKFCPLCGRKTTRIYIFNAL